MLIQFKFSAGYQSFTRSDNTNNVTARKEHIVRWYVILIHSLQCVKITIEINIVYLSNFSTEIIIRERKIVLRVLPAKGL
jgi:hypothetical protein